MGVPTCRKRMEKTYITSQYRGSVQLLATGGPELESQWRRGFLHPFRLVPGLTQPPVQRVPSLFPMGEAAGTCS